MRDSTRTMHASSRSATWYFIPSVLTHVSLKGQFILDYYYKMQYREELWSVDSFSYSRAIDLDIHEPPIMAFHKGAVSNWMEGEEESALHSPNPKQAWNIA